MKWKQRWRATSPFGAILKIRDGSERGLGSSKDENNRNKLGANAWSQIVGEHCLELVAS